MYKDILENLTCPKCGKQLFLDSYIESENEIVDGKLMCADSHTWIIKDGVIIFESQEQDTANNWSEYYRNTDYEELDKKIRVNTPENELIGHEAAKNEVLSIIKKTNVKSVLDIATGRGMLLNYLAQHLDDDINLVCIDLSCQVLKYDRVKVKKINPRLKVNYIACDASKLPFKDNTFDISVSFFGIQNMGKIIGKGIAEGVRVSKNGLLDIGIIIKDDNPQIQNLNDQLKESGYDFSIDSCTETNFYKLHKINDNYKVNVSNIFESIGKKSELDLVPIEGEWFGIAVSRIEKVDNK